MVIVAIVQKRHKRGDETADGRSKGSLLAPRDPGQTGAAMQVGTESKARSNTVEQNMALWKEMVAGTTRGQECCARFKMDMVRCSAHPCAGLGELARLHRRLPLQLCC